MTIKECGFTNQNIYIGVANGEVYLANKDTNKVYKVVEVEEVVIEVPKGKTIKIKRELEDEEKRN